MATDLVPLKLYWSPEHLDRITIATAAGEAFALEAGYGFVPVEGYVYPADRCSTTHISRRSFMVCYFVDRGGTGGEPHFSRAGPQAWSRFVGQRYSTNKQFQRAPSVLQSWQVVKEVPVQ